MALRQPMFEGYAISNGEGKPHQKEEAKVFTFPNAEKGDSPREAVRQLALDLQRKMKLAVSLDVMFRMAEQNGITLADDIARRALAPETDAAALYGLQQELRAALGEALYYEALHQTEAHEQFLGSQTLKWFNKQRGA